jgi:hypothetical protein
VEGYVVIATFAGAEPPEPPEAIAKIPNSGLRSMSTWAGVGEHHTSVGLLHFTDRDAAEYHLRTVVETAFEILSEQIRAPQSLKHIALQHHRGRTLEATSVGSYLTIIHDLANTGFGADAEQQTEDLLESLLQVPGYAGHVEGHEVTLEDEVWALVFWTASPAFETPSDEKDHIAHYRRVR